MSYVGNLNGPKKSEIVSHLGPDYFDITVEQLEDEIQIYIDEERQNEVDPVHIDDNGQPYLFFRAPRQQKQKFYLEKAGYKLYGQVKTFNKQEETLWKKRTNK